MKAIGFTVTTVGLLAYAAVLNGWAVQKMWGWFAVPIFGLSPLSIPAAIGLTVLVGHLTHGVDTKTTEDDDSFGKKLFMFFFLTTFRPLVAVFLSWIVSLFM